MWIFTEHGFFTFVVDRKDPSYVWLRARMREHLEDNFPGIEVTEHPGADYFFRAKVTRAYLAEQMSRLVMDANITSHFKDEMNRRAAKPRWGSISQVMYAVWNGAAQWQPYAPYSKVPRPEPKPFVPAAKGTQGALFPDYSRYGGSRAGDYDWTTGTWKGGTKVGESAPDPRVNQSTDIAPERARQIADMLDGLTEDDFEEIWPTLSADEQAAYLDYQEELADAWDAGDAPQASVSTPATPAPVFSHTEEDHGAQARLEEWFTSRKENAYAAPKGGGRRRGRKRRKK